MVKINISGITMSGESNLLNGAKIHTNSEQEISIKDTELSDKSRILNDLEIQEVISKVEKELCKIPKNSEEYQELQKLLQSKTSGRDDILKKILVHLGKFSEGVLQNVIADLVKGQF